MNSAMTVSLLMTSPLKKWSDKAYMWSSARAICALVPGDTWNSISQLQHMCTQSSKEEAEPKAGQGIAQYNTIQHGRCDMTQYIMVRHQHIVQHSDVLVC